MGTGLAPCVRAQPPEGRRPFLAQVVGGDAGLRRDLGTALELGISPRRLAGWEPRIHTRTTYVYDEAGRISETNATTTTEAEYDEIDLAMIDALLDWRADLHSCGRPLSESLHDPTRPGRDQAQYVVGTQTCRACQALDKRQAERHKDDKALIEAGRNPDAWRLDTVVLKTEAAAMVEAGQAVEK